MQAHRAGRESVRLWHSTRRASRRGANLMRNPGTGGRGHGSGDGRPGARLRRRRRSADRGLGAAGALLRRAPDAGGGSITTWHAHTNVCFSWAGLVGLLSPFGTCPAGSINIAFGPMLHVWTVALPGGPFGLEPEDADVETWLAHRAD